MADGVLIIDGEGAVLVYNRPAEELLGLPHGTLAIGCRLTDFATLQGLHAFLAPAPGGRLETGGEGSLLHIAPGRVLRVDVSWLPARPGAAPTVVLLLHDARDAERLQSMRRDFIANLSHEVRTPLAAIRGCSATLLGGAALDDRERARRFVEMIDQHAERLGQLVDDLGTLADLEQDRIELQHHSIEVGPVIAAAVDACRDHALRGGVVIAASVEPPTPLAAGDRDLLEQALVRLIANAVRYTPHGGRVAVSAGPAPNQKSGETWVRFAVVDTGVGVPAQDVERLGERFYRVDKGRSRARGGSGLGLALVKHIVRVHGGTMEIASEVQRGTSVTLYWPAAARREQACAG